MSARLSDPIHEALRTGAGAPPGNMLHVIVNQKLPSHGCEWACAQQDFSFLLFEKGGRQRIYIYFRCIRMEYSFKVKIEFEEV